MSNVIALCNASDLKEGGEAVPFDVIYAGQTCRAFAIRFEGRPHAYLNRCAHVAMSPTAFLTTPASGCCAPRMVRCTAPTRASAAAGRAGVDWSRYKFPSMTV